ncbi:uncharacterized protein [Battus philenor]
MAIFLALLSEKHFNGYPVVAITTVHGNVDEPQVFINTQKFLNIAKTMKVPIYRGSNFSLVHDYPKEYFYGSDGLGDSDDFSEFEPIEAQSNHAAVALIELSKKYQGELILVTLGPLTNIALAVRLDPGFIDRLLQIYVAAGNIHSDGDNEPEFNANVDVEAYHVVLKNSRPEKVTLIPFSHLVLSHNISKEWRISTLGSIPTEIMRALNVFEQKSIDQSETWIALDPAVMAIALRETEIIAKTTLVANGIYMCENRGFNFNNFTAENEFNARTVLKMNQELYMNMLWDVFSAETIS